MQYGIAGSLGNDYVIFIQCLVCSPNVLGVARYFITKYTVEYAVGIVNSCCCSSGIFGVSALGGNRI